MPLSIWSGRRSWLSSRIDLRTPIRRSTCAPLRHTPHARLSAVCLISTRTLWSPRRLHRHWQERHQQPKLPFAVCSRSTPPFQTGPSQEEAVLCRPTPPTRRSPHPEANPMRAHILLSTSAHERRIAVQGPIQRRDTNSTFYQPHQLARCPRETHKARGKIVRWVKRCGTQI
jgi:hypothetical protein